jgi:hypothetical protein
MAVNFIAVLACLTFAWLFVWCWKIRRGLTGQLRRSCTLFLALIGALTMDQVYWTLLLRLPPGTVVRGNPEYYWFVGLFLAGRVAVPLVLAVLFVNFLKPDGDEEG